MCKMKTCIALSILTACAKAQPLFEPVDFNITEALINNGVNLSAISELANSVRNSSLDDCSAACYSLEVIFGDDHVETPPETTYHAFIAGFWSAQQRDMFPQCVFTPEKARDVSTAILIARLAQCPFAAKSGGHSAVPGGSTISGGLTISFEKMKKLALSDDKKKASFQPGHTWFDIYSALEKDELAVIGGRVASVGVGSLILGGGKTHLSYFSSMYGLACDNVESYELVTASGLIITVSLATFPDLYWALRGGGNNFGLVTQFNVHTIPRASPMWGGTRTYTETHFSALIEAYYTLGMDAGKDGKAHEILSFTWAGFRAAQVELEYADPNPNATVLAGFQSISGAIADTTAVRSLSGLTTLLDGVAIGAGRRQLFWTWTVTLDKELATVTKDVFFEELTPILDAADIIPAISLQVLSEPILEKTQLRGGNALGLDPREGPLMFVLVSVKWSSSVDDARINHFAAQVKNRAFAFADAKGKTSPYLYMNYASPYQNPVAGYGAASKAKLKAVSKKYDPTGLLERLQPGYFKLDKAPYE